ncbi:MAG: type II toxin-antitoxin system HicB family antitoxin [Pseudomonadales bacterium]|jgi:predicted HicB family RNase H-like nuclease|nr:type II toxin-antitoxin system HicB family antitoxin [Pseudomonadales bacterium]
MNFMTYKDYSARIEYNDDDACFVGHIAGIRDVVGFHGESVAELKAAFEEAVDDYLATCKKLKRSPQRPYSGKVMLRIDPGIHAKAAMQAQAEGKSLNAWAQDVLQHAVAPQ